MKNIPEPLLDWNMISSNGQLVYSCCSDWLDLFYYVLLAQIQEVFHHCIGIFFLFWTSRQSLFKWWKYRVQTCLWPFIWTRHWLDYSRVGNNICLFLVPVINIVHRVQTRRPNTCQRMWTRDSRQLIESTCTYLGSQVDNKTFKSHKCDLNIIANVLESTIIRNETRT